MQQDEVTQRKKPELLVPAGSLEALKTAVVFGADAVYIGGGDFGLRAKAKNFSPMEMEEGISFAHAKGVKVYVTANVLAHNDDLEAAKEYFAELRDMKPERCDALIISDPGMFTAAREVWPDAEVHVSTQANNTNYLTYLFWHNLGAKRAVAARELSLAEIREIREKVPGEMEIECFVHGAMCISYSGRCLLSSFLAGRDANRGACTHPCRWKYAVVEESRPGEYLPVYENERGTFLFSSRDLCMVEHVPELVEAGVDSLKIEGRMKSALYVAVAARTYRKAIDDFFRGEETYRANLDWYRAEIAKCTYRRFTTGFYFGKCDADTQVYDGSTYVNEYVYLGIIEEVRRASETPAVAEERDRFLARIEQKNKFAVGDVIEVMKPDGANVPVTVEAMYNEAGEAVESCPHAKEKLWIRLSSEAAPYDLLRAGVAEPC